MVKIEKSRALDFDDAVNVWIRIWNGEFQHRIAASYDVNPGRISEIVKGHRFKGSREAALRMKDSAA